DWYEVDSCWIELAAVRRLLASVLGERPFLVRAVKDERIGHRLVCQVAAAEHDELTPEKIHADCVNTLSALTPTAMAPQHSVNCACPEQGAEEGEDIDAWRRARVITEGAGRPSEAEPAGVVPVTKAP